MVSPLIKAISPHSSRAPHRELLYEALSNYVCLGEIPDYKVQGTQGFLQHKALLLEIETNGYLNPVPLYRGGVPSLLLESQDMNRPKFVSLTDSMKIARQFADRHYELGAKTVGSVYTLAPRSARAIRLAHYEYATPEQSESFGFQEYWEEDEWLVLRASLYQSKDKEVG